MNRKSLLSLYLLFDIFSSTCAWILFFFYRKYNVNPYFYYEFSDTVLHDKNLYLGILFIIPIWILFYTFSGYYSRIYRKSRLQELGITFWTTLIGVILFFFILILDDQVRNEEIRQTDLVKYFTFYFVVQFLLIYIPRVIITTITNYRIKKGLIGFNTIIIGSDEIAAQTYQNIIKQDHSAQKYIIGFVSFPGEENPFLSNKLKHLGTIEDLQDLVVEYKIDELIIAIQNGKRKYIESIITDLGHFKNIVLKIIPQTQDYLMGTVKTLNVLQEPLISISHARLSTGQEYLKRFTDIFLSLIAIFILSPLYLFLIVGVKFSSRGPIFYSQERVGLMGKPFRIIKFRSMIVNAEVGTPLLSSKTDSRITNFGRFMRRSRLDEIPQFFNILKGDMSLVGPRPERQFFIDQIVKVAPYYKLLLTIKPGMTSWGQVKFGYAENIDEMVERLKWDILYLDNMSLQMDIKILIYTALIVLKRSGK
jgi:exopolysaccharide biosynthesis polyprenyl glycosylphosphotransferase